MFVGTPEGFNISNTKVENKEPVRRTAIASAIAVLRTGLFHATVPFY
ncbi:MULTISPECIES: hypothetical protein [Sphingobacterium]|nr:MULTISPECIES: hypothetical protein [Sphingobacterium]MBA8988395.1 hypothetical protein [Sphingobacterium soli]WFB62758.1 hypothetical protein PZ892_13875 [Sphingobacterium sp. WM]